MEKEEKRRLTALLLAAVIFLLIIISVWVLAALASKRGIPAIVDESSEDSGISHTIYNTYMSFVDNEKAPENVSVARMGGADRFETANLIAREGWSSADAVMLASADSYADALSGAPLAYAYDAPIMLVRGDEVSDGVMAEIERLGAKQIYILGGNAAVSPAIENALTAAGYDVARIWGSTRYETSVAIANALIEKNGSGELGEVFIASGQNYPDALAGSSVAALKGSPILYSPANGMLDAGTLDFVRSCGADTAYILGGSSAVGEEAFERLLDAGMLSVDRMGGADRYDTALLIAEGFDDVFTGKDISIATGRNFPDALAGSVLASKKGIPVLLTGNDGISGALKDYIKKKAPQSVYVFGSTGVISEDILKQYLSTVDNSAESLMNIVNIGRCGDKLSYTLDKDGLLTISGTGSMWDFDSFYINNGESDVALEWYGYNSEIRKAVIESGVTDIGDYAFFGCANLEEVVLPASVESIGNTSFGSCDSLRKINIPSSVNTIKQYAFSGCKSLVSITLPDSITRMDDGIFTSCSKLENVNIPSSISCVGMATFDKCYGLKSIKIPENITAIGDYAFNSCIGLESIDIPNTVKSLGAYAFCGCEAIVHFNIPASVESIGTCALSRCSKLDGIDVDPANTQYAAMQNVLFSKDMTSLILCNAGKKGKYVVPPTVTSIADSAFYGCGLIKTIDLPASLESIGGMAFYGCGCTVNAPKAMEEYGYAADATEGIKWNVTSKK